MLRVTEERAEDGDEVEALYDLAFAPGRRALSSYRLREGIAPARGLCLVARDEMETLVGAIRHWPIAVRLDGASDAEALLRSPGDVGGVVDAVLLGPIAVHPIRQGEGLGAHLIGESLALAAAAGWARCLLVGDAPYYSRFGFRRDLAEAVRFPPPTNPNRVLALELTPGAMAGVRGAVVRADGVDPTAPL